MADIFISYSRKDSEHATKLAERLRASGASVWMDTASLAAAETWSGEIVDAIKVCRAFIVLLSTHSVASSNVTKEVALASEKKKTIVPIRIEKCQMNSAMEYALAGLHHVSLFDEVSLLRSFEKLGIAGPALVTDQRAATLGISRTDMSVYPTDTSGTLALLRIAVLPFEDQSPAHDNEWFSDGLTDELISTLGKLDQLFVIDSQSSRIFKNAKLGTKEIAAQLDVRYIVHGAVRKADKNIRVHASLIDTSNGATLWDEKFSGTMDDIFEIQEKTAIDITKGLKLKLTKEEVTEIEDRGTENPEAYELYLKALSIVGIAKEDQFRAIELQKKAITLDPHYADAYGSMAVAYANIFRSHGRKPEILALQKAATEKAVELAPNSRTTYNAQANLYMNLGENDKAIETALKMVSHSPKVARPYSVVGFMYQESGKPAEAAKWYEKALAIDPSSLGDHNNVSACYYFSGDKRGAQTSYNQIKAFLRTVPCAASRRSRRSHELYDFFRNNWHARFMPAASRTAFDYA